MIDFRHEAVRRWFGAQRWRLVFESVLEAKGYLGCEEPTVFGSVSTTLDLRLTAALAYGVDPSELSEEAADRLCLFGLPVRAIPGLPPDVLYLVQGRRVLAELRCSIPPDP